MRSNASRDSTSGSETPRMTIHPGKMDEIDTEEQSQDPEVEELLLFKLKAMAK